MIYSSCLHKNTAFFFHGRMLSPFLTDDSHPVNDGSQAVLDDTHTFHTYNPIIITIFAPSTQSIT